MNPRGRSAYVRAAPPRALAPALHSVAGMRVAFVLCSVVMVAGCYAPRLRDCTVRCANATECGGDQLCGDDGWCASPDVVGRCDAVSDGAVEPPPDEQPDAPTNAACLAVCTNGTCTNGVCTIDCSATGVCPNDVICPAGVPCHVVCGDQSCGHHVDCKMATACTIECIGDMSCTDELRCGPGPCTITCSGASACKRIRCAESCACDATCSGTNACIDTSECPQSGTCRLGEGCTAAGTCDQC